MNHDFLLIPLHKIHLSHQRLRVRQEQNKGQDVATAELGQPILIAHTVSHAGRFRLASRLDDRKRVNGPIHQLLQRVARHYLPTLAN